MSSSFVDHRDSIIDWYYFFAPQGDISDHSPSSMFGNNKFYATITASYVFNGTNGGAHPVEPEDFKILEVYGVTFSLGKALN